MPSVEQKIIGRIETRGRGACFTPKVFLDLGSPEAVRIALHRLVKRGLIRRLARGLYDFPKQHRSMGALSPRPEEVARALSERDATRLQPSGAYAANALGLSEHVPAKVVFLTDGPARRVKIGRQEIILKSTTPRNMATAGRISGTVIQALRFIGKAHLNDAHVERLSELLRTDDKAQLRKDRIYAPDWMHPIIDTIAGGRNA